MSSTRIGSPPPIAQRAPRCPAFILSSLPTTCDDPGQAGEASRARSAPRSRSRRCAAAGFSRASRRIVCRAWRVASAVTAQVLTMTTSSMPGGLGLSAHRLRLVGVEPAAEGDDLDAPSRPPLREERTARERMTPSHSSSTGPVISTWSSLAPLDQEVAAGQRDGRLAAGELLARRGDERRAGGRAAGPGQAGAALPDAQHDVIRRRRPARARCWRARGRSGGSRAAARCGQRS